MWTALLNALEQTIPTEAASASADVVMGEADSAGVGSRQEGARGGCGDRKTAPCGDEMAASTEGQGVDNSLPRTPATVAPAMVSSRSWTGSASLASVPCEGRAAEIMQVEHFSHTLLLNQCDGEPMVA
jgi:hypothetical protein